MARYLSRDTVAIVAAIAAPLVTAAVLLPFRPDWPNTNVALLLVVIVVAVAANGNRAAGALAAVSAAAWFDFFFTRPYERFAISKSADITTAVLLLLVGLAVSQLAARARRLRLVTITDAHYLAQIHDTAELTQSKSPYTVVDHVKEQLTTLLGLEQCRFEYGSLLGHPPSLRPDGTVMAGHHRVDVEQFGLPGEEIELRTFSNGQFIGRFMLRPKPGSKPSRQARLVAVTLADQAGRALGASQAPSGRG
jgi:K+-sensing histidine kinase KdpD